MTRDQRTTLARADLAARDLEGLVRAAAFADTTPFRIAIPRTAQRAAPNDDAEQINQLLFGEDFDALTVADGYAWGRARRDGYVGWVATAALGKRADPPDGRVSALRTAAFSTPSIKSAVWGLLGLNALVTVVDRKDDMALVAGAGWVPSVHLAPIGGGFGDPATAAEMFLGAPYVWGGRDSLGLDCSGLVQQALFAAGMACPRDADQQATLGVPVDCVDLRRGDLVFWQGHVGLMLDSERLLHANAHHMAVAIEPLNAAVARIVAKGVGEPTAFRRP
jgi:cell wall-associated NlpC family hydrolase